MSRAGRNYFTYVTIEKSDGSERIQVRQVGLTIEEANNAAIVYSTVADPRVLSARLDSLTQWLSEDRIEPPGPDCSVLEESEGDPCRYMVLSSGRPLHQAVMDCIDSPRRMYVSDDVIIRLREDGLIIP